MTGYPELRDPVDEKSDENVGYGVSDIETVPEQEELQVLATIAAQKMNSTRTRRLEAKHEQEHERNGRG